MKHLSIRALVASCLLASASGWAGQNLDRAAAATVSTVDTELVDRFIVRLRDPTGDPRPRLALIGGVFGERLDLVREMSGGAHVVRLARRMQRREAREVARLLGGDARIAFIEPDAVMRPAAVPNDSLYAQQWHYHEAQGGINLPAAWDISTGSAAIHVAVIDTGVVAHAELAGRLVGGYDFIGDTNVSNDGDGRDPNASDPGDHGCNGAASSWHGTHVAGTIGASSNNGGGVAGVNWNSRLVPIRVLGRCGGYTSDIVDGLRWAAGMPIPGLPSNPYPVRVANLSLGGPGPCSQAFQSAIDDVVARGTVVVVAAGNDNVDAGTAQPASCNGVIAVAATTRSGGKAAYSNHGARVTIAAPGGGNGNGVLSTSNLGTTTRAGDGYAWFQGTSMATPHVTGVVSLMLSVDPSLSPAQVAERLRASARAFPLGTGADCNAQLCGAGIVDAGAALAAIGPPPPAPPPAPSGWTRIAVEGQDFAVSGTRTVRYGSAPYWISRSVTGSGSCTNAWFGTDPIQGTVKECQVADGPAPPPASEWSTIANEGQAFTVSGTQTVRYGSGNIWISRSVTTSGICSNAFFGGDPLFGVVKRCEVQTAAPPPPSWIRIAGEGESFSVSGTQSVRYGAGTSWTSRSVMGAGQCTNGFFGNDPIFGVVKQCEVPSTTTGARR